MVMSRVEVVMARRQVNAEILSDPSLIIPIRKTKVDDGSGGWTWSTPTPLPQLQVLVTPAKRRLGEMQTNTELGHLTIYPYVIVARHDSDLLRDDVFFWQGDKFEVKSIQIKTQVSIIAQVDYFGGTSNV